MQVATFVEQLKSRGFVLEAKTTGLVVKPSANLTAEDRSHIKKYRDEILAMLQGATLKTQAIDADPAPESSIDPGLYAEQMAKLRAVQHGELVYRRIVSGDVTPITVKFLVEVAQDLGLDDGFVDALVEKGTTQQLRDKTPGRFACKLCGGQKGAEGDWACICDKVRRLF